LRNRAETPRHRPKRSGVIAAIVRILGGTGAPSRRVRLAAGLGASLIALVLAASPAAAATPVVTIDPVATADYTTAHISGEIDPGSEEVSAFADFRVKGSGEPWSERFIQSIPEGAGGTPVEYKFGFLTPATEYEFRITTFSSGGEFTSPGPNPTATTKALAEPTVTLEPVTNVTATTAHFGALINPNSPEPAPTSPIVEEAFSVQYTFECTPSCPSQLTGKVPADNTAHLVTVTATGLLPNTQYEVTLRTENAAVAGAKTQGPATFVTPPAAPQIKRAATLRIAATEATIAATIVPNGAATGFFVEYGPTASYGDKTAEQPVGSDDAEHEVKALLSGLAPASSYHWRIVAGNAVDETVDGTDHTFNTFSETPSFALPDSRAYEQVSPPDKGGVSVEGELGIPHSSPNGDHFGFYTISTLPGSESGQNYGLYLASRGANNWATEGLLPPASFGREAEVLSWSNDLSESFINTYHPGRGTTVDARDNATRGLTLIAPNISARFIGTSANDDELMFQSEENLAPGAASGPNIYVRRKSDGTIILVGVLNSGEAPESGSSLPGGRSIGLQDWRHLLSSDGTNAYFASVESQELYLRRNPSAAQSLLSGGHCIEQAAACTLEVSRSQRTVEDPLGPNLPTYLTASTQGPPVAFFSSAEKLTNDATTGPDDEGNDLYRYEGDGETLTDLVPDHSDPNGAEVLGALGASADGSRIYFVADGVLGDGLSHGAELGSCIPESEEGDCNLYEWILGSGVHFIARLSGADIRDWHQLGEKRSRDSRLSTDGSVVIFRSHNALTSDPTEGISEFYRYSEAGETLVCMTCAPGGAAPVAGPRFAGPTLFSFGTVQGPEFESGLESRNLNASGTRFFFESPDKLVPEDVNGEAGCPETLQYGPGGGRCQDVYEWEAPGVGSCASVSTEGCVYLISSGTSDEPSYFGDADVSGDDVFFYTGQQLVRQDKDDLVDVYDARVNGGLAAQDQPPQAACVEDAACRGSGTSPPAESAPGTVTFAGPGNQKPPAPRCKKGFRAVKRHGKTSCVRKKQHHKKHHKQSHGSPKKSHQPKGGSK
jgi:hypothetical protein